MQSVVPISLDSDPRRHPVTVSIQNGGPGVSSSTTNIVLPKQPAPKKPTRQWAAWTRQEEERFFTALRQVGKNFEKITCHVQSKNKDQVRHYYYRLLRRMNKLLGPELCLDAKNFKDTNAAMLRWWSLLEKFSCKASKLHLKPRKFKIFVEALEHQLMKDRKKNVRRRPLLGENYPPAAPNTVSNQNRTLGNDAQTVKQVLVDSQNIQNHGTSKASSKRNVNMGVNRSNTKGEPVAMKPSRQRKKPGLITAAAYKKWEKAAMAGVSLVADAAEHLERAATVKDVLNDQGIPGEKCADPVGSVPPSLPLLPQNCVDNNMQNLLKLKLQLFPIDDCTRRALERDNHNPHLELTLSTRKKISSIMDHLYRKWGNSSIAVGQLMLFPYNIQEENLASYQRWTQESTVSAGDVYGMIGSPPVFRLRYGWFSHAEVGPENNQVPIAFNFTHGQSSINVNGHIMDPSLPTTSTNNFHQDICEDKGTSITENLAPTTTPYDLPNARDDNVSLNPSIKEPGDATLTVSSREKGASDEIMTEHMDEIDEMRLNNGTGFSAGEWADSLTNISLGDLLSGAYKDVEDERFNRNGAENCNALLQLSFSADSFDAAIAAHIARYQGKTEYQPTLASHTSSIWNAEETCDAFLFKKDHISREGGPCLSTIISTESHKQVPGRNSDCSDHLVKQSPRKERPGDNFVHTVPLDGFESKADIQDHSAKDFSELADMCWPDSLGPLDLDTPSTKYHSQDLILSDSLSGLNRLIASSLDAFQNCSFFGIDKKEP